jgi:hypothetical protein
MSIQGSTRSTSSFDIEAGPGKNGSDVVPPQLITSRLDLSMKLKSGHDVRHAMRPAISKPSKRNRGRSVCQALVEVLG